MLLYVFACDSQMLMRSPSFGWMYLASQTLSAGHSTISKISFLRLPRAPLQKINDLFVLSLPGRRERPEAFFQNGNNRSALEAFSNLYSNLCRDPVDPVRMASA